MYYNKIPDTLLPVTPTVAEAASKFETAMDVSLATTAVAFVDQVLSHTVHGLPNAMVKQAMNHKIDDKYLSLGSTSDLKAKPFVGPKKSKFRKLMSTRQRKANQFDILSPEHESYELYVPLHELWKQYIGDLMSGSSTERAHRFARCDWHGALLNVVKSCIPGIVGLRGIVLQETGHTFKIITEENKYCTLPKRNTVFAVVTDASHVAIIYGNHIMYKSAERSSRKFKAKQTIDIGNGF